MIYKYFNLTIQDENLDEQTFCFYFLEKPYKKNVIAQDDSSNYIANNDTGVYIYINDADEEQNYIKLFDNIDEFYKNIDIYDQQEFDRRYSQDINPSEINQYKPEDISPCSVYTSTFVKHLGGKRIIPKYKEGAYYNISQAYIDGTITKEEFILLSHL